MKDVIPSDNHHEAKNKDGCISFSSSAGAASGRCRDYTGSGHSLEWPSGEGEGKVEEGRATRRFEGFYCVHGLGRWR